MRETCASLYPRSELTTGKSDSTSQNLNHLEPSTHRLPALAPRVLQGGAFAQGVHTAHVKISSSLLDNPSAS